MDTKLMTIIDDEEYHIEVRGIEVECTPAEYEGGYLFAPAEEYAYWEGVYRQETGEAMPDAWVDEHADEIKERILKDMEDDEDFRPQKAIRLPL